MLIDSDQVEKCSLCHGSSGLQRADASEFCVACLGKLELLSGNPMTIRNDIGGVPNAITTDGGFKCIICEAHNYKGGLVCIDCKETMEAVKRMRT